MSIDLDKNRDAILSAYNEVLSDKTKTDWALFGYEGQTYVLKVIGTGEDGVEELAEDLNSSKVMYAVVKVTDPNTTRPKIVLINWQGEGAPTLRKGTCARHLTDVNKFLRGIHVTVNARTEEEVEPEVVMAAVLKASATTYNFNERSEINEKTTPVRKPTSGPAVRSGDGLQNYPSKMPKPKMTLDMGTNYKRTNPLAEINTKSRNQFWEEQEAEEKRRKNEEQQKRDEELKLLEKERKQREIDEMKHRDALVKERNTRIIGAKKAEEEAEKRLAAQKEKQWQNDVESQYQEEQERAKRAEMMRLERKKEAEALIGHRTHSTRAMFESGNTTSEQSAELNRPPPRKLKEFNPTNATDKVENNEPAQVLPSRGVTARWPPANNTAQKEDTSSNQNRDKIINSLSIGSKFQNQINQSVPTQNKHNAVSAPHQNSIQPQSTPQKQQSPQQLQKQQSPLQQQKPQSPQQQSPQHQKQSSPQQQQQSPQQQKQPSPQQQQSPITSQQPTPTQPVQPQPTIQPQSNGDVASHNYSSAVSNNVNHFQNDHVYDAAANTSQRADEIQDTVHQNNSSAYDSTPTIGMVYEVDGMEYQILPEHGLCARALYDYQAADDTEITFDPEEIITNIDQIDAGWWQGVGPDGNFGLFPANYVELINHSGI